jgi:hypothetical protein
VARETESNVHIPIVSWIKANEEEYRVLKTIFHCPNSFFGTSFSIVAWLKKLGLRRGVYDLIVPVAKGGYAGLWIEVKTIKGKLSTEQKDYARLINEHSDIPTLFVVVTDAENGINTIKNYLSIV